MTRHMLRSVATLKSEFLDLLSADHHAIDDAFYARLGEVFTAAQIVELGDGGITARAYDDLDAVRLTRGFLEAPERYLRAALEDPDTDGSRR